VGKPEREQAVLPSFLITTATSNAWVSLGSMLIDAERLPTAQVAADPVPVVPLVPCVRAAVDGAVDGLVDRGDPECPDVERTMPTDTNPIIMAAMANRIRTFRRVSGERTLVVAVP
jgi:hypothetical protein